MSQHDYIISDAVGSVFLSDLNSNLQAIVTDNSGTTEPTVTYANMVWADTSTSPPTIKRRNALNTAWVSENDMSGNVTISTNNSSTALTITQDGTGNCLVVNDQSGDSSPFVIGNAGNVCIGGGAVSSQNLRLSKNLTGNTTVYGFVSQQTILSDVTNAATLNYSGLITQAASFNIPVVKHYSANQESIGAGSTVTTQYGFIAESSLTGASTNYGFYGGIPYGAGRWNFYALGDAPNYMAGGLGIGTTASSTRQSKLVIAGSHNGSTNTRTIHAAGSVDPTVATNDHISVLSDPSVASGGTLPILTHFLANQSVISGAVTTQIGFSAASTLTGASNNYGFYGGIASASNRYNFYAAGTAPNYYAGDVRTNTTVTEATTVTNSDSSTTLTAANLLGHIVSGNPVAGINYTLPTGTSLDSAFQNLSNNQAFNWSVINLAAATHAITLLANTAHTIVGYAVVQANTSGTFRTRKTATNTFVTYRIS